MSGAILCRYDIEKLIGCNIFYFSLFAFLNNIFVVFKCGFEYEKDRNKWQLF